MRNLLGQGEVDEGGNYMEQCAGSSAPSLEDVRNAQGQVALSSEEQHAADWSAQVSLNPSITLPCLLFEVE